MKIYLQLGSRFATCALSPAPAARAGDMNDPLVVVVAITWGERMREEKQAECRRREE